MPDIPGINRPAPGYRYLGPGNYGYIIPPTSQLDSLARDHDLAYEGGAGWGPVVVLSDLAVAEADGVLALRAAQLALDPQSDLGPGARLLGLATASLFGNVAVGKYLVLGTAPGLGSVVQRLPEDQQRRFAVPEIPQEIRLAAGRQNPNKLAELEGGRRVDINVYDCILSSGTQQKFVGPSSAIQQLIDRGIITEFSLDPQEPTMQQRAAWAGGMGDPQFRAVMVSSVRQYAMPQLADENGIAVDASAAQGTSFLDMLNRINASQETIARVSSIRAPSVADLLAQQQAYITLQQTVAGGGDMGPPFAPKFGFRTVKISTAQFMVVLDDINCMIFPTRSKADNVVKKGNAMLRRIVSTSSSVEEQGFPAALGQFLMDGANPANNFIPPLIFGH